MFNKNQENVYLKNNSMFMYSVIANKINLILLNINNIRLLVVSVKTPITFISAMFKDFQSIEKIRLHVKCLF